MVPFFNVWLWSHRVQPALSSIPDWAVLLCWQALKRTESVSSILLLSYIAIPLPCLVTALSRPGRDPLQVRSPRSAIG
jgi:hypothetical protein